MTMWMQSWRRCWCVLTSKSFTCSRDCKPTSFSDDVILDVTLTSDTTVQPQQLSGDNSFAFRLAVSAPHLVRVDYLRQGGYVFIGVSLLVS